MLKPKIGPRKVKRVKTDLYIISKESINEISEF